jgi:hypothetical protein
VDHHAEVKARLIELLTSEVVAVENMHHAATYESSDINDEGVQSSYNC